MPIFQTIATRKSNVLITWYTWSQ